VEPARDQPVAALARVQPVDRPHPRIAGLGVLRGVIVQRAETLRQPVHHLVDLVHPAGQRPGHGAGQAEHLARVGHPHGQHLGTRGAQRAHRVRGRRGDLADVEVGPERVVDPDDEAGDVRAHLQRARELVTLHIGEPRPARREDVQPRLVQPPGEQRGPAAPGPALAQAHPPSPPSALLTHRVADTQRDRVTQGCERRHADTSIGLTVCRTAS
jgi:hypothetical protein